MPRINYTITYDIVHLTGQRSGKCSGCGNRTKRSYRAEQTINPYNKTAAGAPKTRADILPELREELKKWETTPLRCTKCEQ